MKKKISKKKAVKKVARKTPKKKPIKKTVKKTAKKVFGKVEKPIGVVTHFYTAIKVAIVKFKKPVRVGARLRFQGSTTNFEFDVKSMQFDHKAVTVAAKGKQIGIKVGKRVREGDGVYEVK